jgi:hypothetical protein
MSPPLPPLLAPALAAPALAAPAPPALALPPPACEVGEPATPLAPPWPTEPEFGSLFEQPIAKSKTDAHAKDCFINILRTLAGSIRGGA